MKDTGKNRVRVKSIIFFAAGHDVVALLLGICHDVDQTFPPGIFFPAEN